MKNSYKTAVEHLFSDTDIKINGTRPWDIKVNNEETYKRILSEGALGLGESYVEGWWDCEQLDKFFYRLLKQDFEKKASSWKFSLDVARARISWKRPEQSRAGRIRFDLNNELYQYMLDKRMTNSCGYWKKAKTLDEAQAAKLDMICKKISLKRGDKILDAGCGFGSFAKFAAEKYGAKVTATTTSREHAIFARKQTKDLPVEVLLSDFRELDGKFDHIVSIGMLEQRGYEEYSEYMRTMHRLLNDDGFFLLETSGSNTTGTLVNSWTDKYISPNAVSPSINAVVGSSEGLFVLEDMHSMGADYDLTLRMWHKNLKKNWNKLKDDYDYVSFRMWAYHILSQAASFRARKSQVWQFVFTKKGVEKRYEPAR